MEVVELEHRNFHPASELLFYQQDIAKVLGKIIRPDGSIYGTATPVRFPGREDASLLVPLHSFQDHHEGTFTFAPRRLTFGKNIEIYVSPDELIEANSRPQPEHILILPINNPDLAALAIELVKPPRGSFRIGTEIAIMGFPNDYLEKYNLGEVIASLGVVRKPVWDNPRFLTTTATPGVFGEFGMSGAPVVNGKGLIGGFVVLAERIRVCSPRREQFGSNRQIVTQAIPIARILPLAA